MLVQSTYSVSFLLFLLIFRSHWEMVLWFLHCFIPQPLFTSFLFPFCTHCVCFASTASIYSVNTHTALVNTHWSLSRVHGVVPGNRPLNDPAVGLRGRHCLSKGDLCPKHLHTCSPLWSPHTFSAYYSKQRGVAILFNRKINYGFMYIWAKCWWSLVFSHPLPFRSLWRQMARLSTVVRGTGSQYTLTLRLYLAAPHSWISQISLLCL